MARKVIYKENKFIEPCPKCGNNTVFKIHSQQVQEDGCEIWAECKCGYDPTSYENFGTGNRVEDVWGGTDDANCQDAITFAWNDTLRDGKEKLSLK